MTLYIRNDDICQCGMQECLYLLESHHLMSASCSILDSERRLSRVVLIFFFQTLFIRFPSQKTPTAFFFSTTSTTSIQRLSIQAIDFNPPSLFFEPLPIAKAPFFFATNNPPKKTTTTESSVWNLLFFFIAAIPFTMGNITSCSSCCQDCFGSKMLDT